MNVHIPCLETAYHNRAVCLLADTCTACVCVEHVCFELYVLAELKIYSLGTANCLQAERGMQFRHPNDAEMNEIDRRFSVINRIRIWRAENIVRRK
jgi:hypothetical protein